MANSGNFLESKAFKNVLAKTYAWGAAIVIVGALFKIMHWPGAGAMLTVGLSTEAVIFFISGFEKQKEDPDWTLVYPELAGGDKKRPQQKKDPKKSATQEFEKMLEEAKIEQKTINSLGQGLKSFSDSVSKMNTITEATVATQDYTEKVKKAAQNIEQVNKSYGRAAEAYEQLDKAVKQLSTSANATNDYSNKINQASKNVELASESFAKSAKAYDKIGEVVSNVSKSADAAGELNTQVSKLSKNLSNLNAVYGNMLSAMSAPRS